ncbi:hypothetical protein [Streptomyces sp. NRRL F-4489]|uniref:hypothetical protein n=1 Tax=Streptomyces sp. NRRL F-4489 TaxID=1609095 RepID=UPI000AB7B721|nr:hypothetical protein [Streptomyces sp. NRRL F-4489]
MINSGSRYADHPVEIVTDAAGATRQVLGPAPPKTLRVRAISYRWQDGDRVDTVATEFYRDPTQWWRIAEVNPEILDWTEIAPGTAIRIPHAD